jgi:hypothetical protein
VNRAGVQFEEATSRRVASYLRRSTDEDNQPFSLEAQDTKNRYLHLLCLSSDPET